MKFNIKAILSAAATVAGTLNPGVGVAIGVINQLLPKEKQLPITATGQDCEVAIKDLPPAQQSEIYNHEIDLELAQVESHTTIQTALAQVDKAGASARPNIAMIFAIAICFIEVPLGWGMTYAVFTGDEPLKDLAGSWPLILAMTTPLVGIIGTYFGNRTDEKKTRYSLAHGQPLLPQPLGLIGKLLK